jgi:hypothetical protein
MKAPNINRRDYLKTTTAGVILASTPAGTVTSRAQEATPGAPVAERQRVDGLPNQPVAEGTFFRADLSRCSPAEKLSRTFEEGRWQLTDYETVEGVKGVLVSAYPEHDCGKLTLPLDAKGPHKVFLGINYTKAKYPNFSPYGLVQVKLDGDPGFRRVGIEAGTVTGTGDLKIGINNFNHKAIRAGWSIARVS